MLITIKKWVLVKLLMESVQFDSYSGICIIYPRLSTLPHGIKLKLQKKKEEKQFKIKLVNKFLQIDLDNSYILGLQQTYLV